MSSTLFVLDKFHEADGTFLPSTTPTYGGLISAVGPQPAIYGYRVVSRGAGHCTYGVLPATEVYTVEADVYVASIADGFTLYLGGMVLIYTAAAGQFSTSGTGINAATASYSFVAGRTYKVRADVTDAAVNAYVNGQFALTATTTATPSAGPVGLGFPGGPDTSATGFQFALFTAWYAPAAGMFDVICQSDAQAFIDADTGLGEQVVYVPAGQSGSTISAMVRRTPPERLPGLNQVSGNLIDVWIANDATLGVTSVQVGLDQMILSGEVGGTPKLYTVNRIVNQDAGTWHLQLV